MNANCYKVIFSKRLGTLVAVGEHTTSSGKAASGQAVRGVIHTIPCFAGIAGSFVGVLRFSFASIALACLSIGTTQAQSSLPTIATSALPQGASVNKGSASISTSGAQMAINQSSDKASINWQSFNVGTGASVNIAQPSASAVLLNRVVGNDPSQILGKLSANGQVILLNPNGILFGKDGSVTASTFTASTFGMSDADFMNGFYKYNRNGSTASVVNQGTIEVSRGGYVALIGATVTNEGKIIAPQGDVVMAAAESVTLPEELVTPKPNTSSNTVSVRMSKRVRLELAPAAINAAVSNTESGLIVTEGGQVLLQAAAISAAVASVTHSGNIDTSAPQAGAVTLLAENGSVKVEGSIKSNSSGNHNGTSNRGGDIIIGRDEETGALSKTTDVSAAKLESNHGFVETSGQHLIVDGVQVKADQWLLDPTDITITSADSGIASTGTNPITLAPNTSGTTASTINTSTLETNLSAGTNVIVRTTNASGTGNGDITVASNIAVTGGSDATLTLQAERDIVIDSNVSIARTGTNKLNVILNSDLDGNGAGAIVMNTGSSISTNGGNITLGGGTAGTGVDYAKGYTGYAHGVSLSGASLNANGGNINVLGQGSSASGTGGALGVSFTANSSISTTGAGNITLDGRGGATGGANSGVSIQSGSSISGSSTGTVNVTGVGGSIGDNNHGVLLTGVNSKITTAGGSAVITGTGGGTSSAVNNDGVLVQNSANVGVTGSGSLTVTGTGGDTTGGSNHGLEIVSYGTLTAVNGDITLSGTSGTKGNSSFGVNMTSAGAVTTTGGNVSMTATSQTNAQYGYGFYILGTNTKISTGGNGNVTVNAISSATGSTDALGAQIRSTGAITTSNGNINVTATSRGVLGNYNDGIGFNGGSFIAGGAGTVSITGTGGSVGTYSYGVSNPNITTAGGAVTITASTSSTGANSSAMEATSGTISTSGGNVTYAVDSYKGGSTETVNAGSGTVTLQNRTAGTLIDVGGTSTDVVTGTLKLGVSSAELGRISAGTVVVGRNDATGSGNVTVNALNMGALGNTAGNLTVLSGNDITVSGAVTKSTGADANLNLSAVNGVTVSANIGGTVAGTGKLNVSITASGNSASAANSKGITITKVVDANGGTVSLAGTNRTSAGGNTNSGITLNGATILAQTLTATGIQTGSNTGQNSNGIYFTNSNTLTTSSGVSTITGSSNAIGNFGGGLYLDDNTSLTVNSGAGSIEFSGTNSNIGYRGIRIGSTSNTTMLNATGNISFEDTGFQTFLRGSLTLNSNTTVTLKGKAVQIYGGGIVQKAGGATGTTLNLDAQTVTVGDAGAGSASVSADTINLIGRSTSTGSIDIQILKGSTLTSTGVTTVTTSGLGNTAFSSDADTTIAATGGLVVNIGKSGTLRSVITGGTSNAGGLTKQGAGTLSLNNANTMNGTTLVSAGILNLNNVNALQNSTLDTGIYEISPANTYSVAFGVTGSNTYNFGGLQGGDALAIGANGISVGANNSTTTYSGVLSGSGALTKVGTGNLTLSGKSTKTGNYNANAGTLTLTGVANEYRDFSTVSVYINNGATVAIPNILNGGFVSNNVTWTFGSAGGGTIDIGSNFVNRGLSGNKFVTTGGATNTISGNINLDANGGGIGPTFDIAAGTAGAAGLIHTGNSTNSSASQNLTKTGAGTLVLSGTNDYKGSIAVNAGTLQLGNGSTTGILGANSGVVTVGNGATLQVNRSDAITLSNTISGAGNFGQIGAGTTTLTANNTYSGTTTVSGGTLQVGAAGTTGLIGAGAVTLSNNANLNFVRAATTNISNDISGTGNLNATISGSNSDLTLAGTTNITGAIAASSTGSILTTGGKNISTTSGVSLAGQNGVAIYSNITNSTSGAITITAGDNSTTSTAAIVSAAGATITQNAAAAVTMTTDALGDLAVAKIVKGAGAGDVTVASGIKLAAGVAGGDIKTVVANAITNNGSGKTLIYTGSSGESGLMSNLHGSLATLYLTANTGQTQNAVTRTAYGSGGGFAGGPSTQVLFREAADITPSINGATLAKNYGDAAPSTAELITALTAANNGATTSASSTAGTLVASTADVISDIANHVDLNASSNSFSRINANSAGYSYSASGSNFAANGASPNVTLIVNKINASVTADSDATKIYNGLSQTLTGFTATGLLSGETESALTGVTVSGSGTNVGTYTTTASGTDTNYNLSFTNGSMVIGKANLSAIGAKVYDASNTFSGNSFTSITGVNGETFTASGSGTLASANVQTNQALSSLGTLSLAGVGGALTSNYNALSTAQTSVNVTPRALSVIGSNTTTTYSGTAQTNSGVTITGTQGSDGFTVTGYGTGTNANSSAYADNLSLTGSGSTQLSNYNIAYTNGGLTIGKANLTLSGTRAYDGGTTFGGTHLTATGVNSETFTVIGLGNTSNLASKNVQTNQTLSSITGLSLGTSSNGGLSGNYNALTTNASSVSVTAKAASVNATSTTLTYNGALQNQSTPTSSGFVNTDDIVISGLASGKNAATYASQLSVTGNDASNYNVTVVDANLVINQAPLTVTATQVSKTYDSSTSASGTPTVGTLAGSGAGEVINHSGFQTFTNANAGTGKTVQAAGVTIKNASSIDVTSNYDITYVNNTTSEIEKAPLTIKANNDARFVTLNDAAGFNGVSYSGFVGTETNTALGGTLAITRQNALTDVAAGTYTGVLIPSGLTSNNYDISYSNGNYTIVQANTLLIKTTNQALSYGSTPAFNATAQYLDASNNVIHTLTPSASGNTYLFTDGATGSATLTLKPYLSTGGLAPLSNSGNTVVGVYDVQASNPTIVGNNFNGSPVFIGALTVLPKAVTPSTTNVSKTYDGTTSMNNMDLGLAGKLAGDNLLISGTGAFNQKNAGQGLSYTYSNIMLSGSDVSNYYLSGGTNQFTGTNGVITPAALSLSPSSVSKVYDGTTTATGSLQVVQGTQLFGTDTVSGGSFSFTDPSVGVGNKTVQLSGVTVSDDNSGNNYAITYIDNTTSSITESTVIEKAKTVSNLYIPSSIVDTELFTRSYFKAFRSIDSLDSSNSDPIGLESCISTASSDCVCKVESSASKDGPVSCSGGSQSVNNTTSTNSDG